MSAMRSIFRPALFGALSIAGAAGAQACLSVSDGVGGVHLTCPDGRTGFLQDTGAGALAGMIGAQPYITPSTNFAPPVGLPGGSPAAAYVAPPLSTAQVPQSAPTLAAPTVPAVNPPSRATLLLRRRLEEQAARDRAHEPNPPTPSQDRP